MDNGAGTRSVIGTGIPFRPYERIGGKSEAQFRFSLLTNRTDPAFRITVRLFSARADRLFVEVPLSVTPGAHNWENEQGSQLVKTVREGSRLRALVRRRVVATATWWHVARDPTSPGVPNVNVAFFEEKDRAGVGSDVNEKALREYGVARLFPEVTVLAMPEKATGSTASAAPETLGSGATASTE